MDTIKKINKAKVIWEIIPNLTVKQLEDAITVAADYYHNTNQSLITDEVYDILVERLKKISPKSKVLKQTGAPIKGKKVELPYWMGSMDKIKTDEGLIEKWTDTYKGPYVVSDKLDGISCLLVVTDGEISLYTRGDGSYGQDITHLLDLINISTEKLLKSIDDAAIRGELIMTKENFEKYAGEMSNARNMVGGVVNSKKESVNKKYAADVDFITYEIIEPRFTPLEQLKTLKKWGMYVVYYDVYEDIDFTILDSILQKRKKKSDYEIDGIIITENRSHVRNKSGNPSYSFAYKGMTETADVKVIEVIWTPSKDGYLIPRIHYETVRLSQADLDYTAGFNARFIVKNKIGPGAIITMIRSGDVIPHILGVVKPAKKPDLPTDYDYVWDDNEVNLIVENADDNETVIIKRLTKFMKNIGVENMSEGIITRLVKAGYDNIPKIISITVDDLLELDGFQDKLANKLVNGLQTQLKKLDILKLMVASNSFGRGFGERKIKKVLNVYPNIVDEYSVSKRKAWEKKLMDLEGFDTISVEKFLDSMAEFQIFYKVIKKKLPNIKPYVSLAKTTGIFKDEKVVFTGFRNKDWQTFIESEGGKVSGSVSKNTTLLVYNDGEESSAKFQNAKKLGIKTMSKSQFAKKYDV
jgi:DNA ligase (NAD+)